MCNSHQSGDFCPVMRYPASLLLPLKLSAQVDMTPGLSTVKKYQIVMSLHYRCLIEQLEIKCKNKHGIDNNNKPPHGCRWKETEAFFIMRRHAHTHTKKIVISDHWTGI